MSLAELLSYFIYLGKVILSNFGAIKFTVRFHFFVRLKEFKNFDFLNLSFA